MPSIQGWKTYATAALAVAAGVYALINGHRDEGINLILYGFGLIGIRSAMAKIIAK